MSTNQRLLSESFSRSPALWPPVRTVNDLIRHRLLLVLALALASVIVSAGSAVAGDPNGVCICIEVNGHCYSLFC